MNVNSKSKDGWTPLDLAIKNKKSEIALNAADASGSPAPIKLISKLPYWVANGAEMAKLFLMPAIDSSKYQPAVR